MQVLPHIFRRHSLTKLLAECFANLVGCLLAVAGTVVKYREQSRLCLGEGFPRPGQKLLCQLAVKACSASSGGAGTSTAWPRGCRSSCLR